MNEYSQSKSNALPDWLTDVNHPMSDIIGMREQPKPESARPSKDEELSRYLAQKQAINQEIPQDGLQTDEDSGGVVLLVWFDGASPEPVTEGAFTIKSGFHIAKYTDFSTVSERDAAVVKLFGEKTEYEQSPSRRGKYGIVVGKLVKNVEFKNKTIQETHIEF